MPNHVLNRLTIPNAEDAKEAFSFMGADDGVFDFERICPIPPHVWRGDVNDPIAKIFGAKSRRFGDLEFVEVYETGDTWLPWCIEHWGTKWNSYSFERVNDTTVQFETAWNAVPRIVLLLAYKFDILEFVYEWADEDFGSNTGRITGEDWSGSLHIDIYQPEGLTKEAFEMAASVRSDWVKTDGNSEGFYWDESKGEIEYYEGGSDD